VAAGPLSPTAAADGTATSNSSQDAAERACKKATRRVTILTKGYQKEDEVGDRHHSSTSDDPSDNFSDKTDKERRAERWVLWLLLIPTIAYIYPPWYAKGSPDLAGIPFFIWYQFAWVIGGVAVTAFVYWFRDLRGGR
jgi:Protein of unknown function (DUF3311)